MSWTISKISRPYYVGIDYSMSSPAVCVCYSEEFHFDNCNFFYLTKEKSKLIDKGQFFSSCVLLQDFPHNELRFHKISEWVTNSIMPTERPKVFLEGYSFSSKGQVFNIGELTGVLKNSLFRFGITPEILAPGTIKKFATGNGSAKKPEMLQAFKDDTGTDLEILFGVEERKNKSPAADVADAYFICKLGAFRD